MTAQISLMVVDDHSIFRAGLVQILSGEADFRIVGETPASRNPKLVVSL